MSEGGGTMGLNAGPDGTGSEGFVAIFWAVKAAAKRRERGAI